jgi:glycosyltransferase involved in cell wall biosynthesis
MRSLSIVNAFWKNPGMLARHYENLASLPADLKPFVQYLVCDDASPKGLRAAPPADDIGVDVQVFRLKKKVAWNWIAARNVGAHHATGDILLFTDVDHIVPEATIRRLVAGKLDKKAVYRFTRVDAPDLTPYKSHPNSWAMTRAMFDRFGGFDERYSGAYGSDGSIRDRLTAIASEVIILDEYLIRVPREVVPDASTTDLGRKGSVYNHLVSERRAKIAAEGGPPLTMSFSYKPVT